MGEGLERIKKANMTVEQITEMTGFSKEKIVELTSKNDYSTGKVKINK